YKDSIGEMDPEWELAVNNHQMIMNDAKDLLPPIRQRLNQYVDEMTQLIARGKEARESGDLSAENEIAVEYLKLQSKYYNFIREALQDEKEFFNTQFGTMNKAKELYEQWMKKVKQKIQADI